MFAPTHAPPPDSDVQSEVLSFIHFKESRNYTVFNCVTYHTPPALKGNVGDIFITGSGADATTWVRGHQGWSIADKTSDDKGVPKQVHPDYLGYIRLDPKDSRWKSTWDFRPKPAQRKRKKPSGGQEEQSGSAGTSSAVDTASILEILGAMKDCQERTIAELVAVKDDHTLTRAELDSLKEDHKGTKAELEHAKANIQRAEKEVQSLKAELASSTVNLARAHTDLEQSKASIQLAAKEIQGLKADLTSPPPTPMDTTGGTEIEDMKSKLQAAEATIESMRAQIALTNANLDALVLSNASNNPKEDLHVGDLKHRIRTMLDNMDL